jgi:hypothetical protein
MVVSRRQALKAAGAAAGAIAGSTLIRNVPSAEKLPEIQGYRTLGKTGQKISDLSLGGGGLSNPSVVSAALSMGITYIDTAPDYGRSEDTIGRGQKMSGISRDKFHITTKICRPGGYPGHLPRYRNQTSKDEIIGAVEGSLKRLRTDYIDNLLVHAVGERRPYANEEGQQVWDYERLKSPELHLAFEELKKAGKVRFLGLSTHGPHRPLDGILWAIESGKFDLFMPAYNFYSWRGDRRRKIPSLAKLIEMAHAKGVGVIAMKTLRGGKQAKSKGVLPRRGAFQHNAFKWVWSNEAVAGLVVTMPTLSRIKFFMKASGQKLAAAERQEIDTMMAATSADVCRIGCGECLERCHKGVEIPTVFRAEMYATDHADPAKAEETYAALRTAGIDASPCASCSNPTCVNACTYGIDIRRGMIETHRRLGRITTFA